MDQGRWAASMLAVGAMAFATAAHGQTRDEGNATDRSSGTGAEVQSAGPADDAIVVTAQKRSENVQDVPISISAFSAATLEKANIESLADLPRVAPGLLFDTGISAAKARIVIRGIGSAAGTAVEPSVATFVDGIYIPREGATIGSYLDLAAVEVLRGPQGTLFGRNASVGAISLRTAEPEDYFSGRMSVEAATGPRYKAEGHVNLPLGDTAAFRVAAMGERFDGYYRNRHDGKRLGGVDSFAMRASGKFDLASNLSAIVRFNYSRREGDGFANYALIGDTIPPNQRAAFLANYALIGSTVDLDPFDRTVNQFSGDRLTDRQWGVNSTISYDMAGGFTIRLLSGYSHWKNDQIGTVIIGATVPTFHQNIGWKSNSHSQELQIISPQDELLGGALSFVGGLYYFHEGYATYDSQGFAEGMCRMVFRNLPAALFNSCLAHAGNNAFDQTYRQTTDSIAAYGQATIKIAPVLDLVLGARWTQDKKKARIVQVVNATIGTLVATNEDTMLRMKDDRPTWRANLNFRPTDDALIFASYSTGFKSGGFNNQTAPADGLGPLGQRRNVRAETVESWELGLKSEWFDRALTLNATLFRMKIKDFQDRSYNGVSTSLQNSGDIRNQGFELEAVVRPAEGLRFNFAATYLESEFTRAEPASNYPGLPGLQDITGKRPTFTPKWQGSAGVEYESAIRGSGLGFLARADLSFISDSNIGSVNDANPVTIQQAFQVLSARMVLFGPDEKWSLAAFANNIFDKGYCTSFAYQPFGGLINAVGPNGTSVLRCLGVSAPRTIGFQGTVRF